MAVRSGVSGSKVQFIGGFLSTVPGDRVCCDPLPQDGR